ncbi:MAG: biotin--[acetyl-CoA-carboxylase] ligase [Betaproteobacteria bacterium]|nr:biotin--[acetyl-CoA-carboxylase] ligase [Betaproteobacteria bacterium]MCL2886822.1 biotin--[acetyl-CoA-carboxylase] ligase [Betaproteobacteria bacterium]
MPLIDPALLKARLGELAGRFDVDALDVCDSTSSELLRRADAGAPAGTVIVADRQEAGRGRRGRVWLSSPEGSLTFSLLWRFAGPPARLGGLSLAVGLALAQALEAEGARGIGLKWPNDLLLATPAGHAKLAGVLIELTGNRRGCQAIIGIGINLRPPPAALPDALAQPPAGLDQAGLAAIDRHALLAAILRQLAAVLDIFAGEGFAALRADWQRRHIWQDRPVQVLDAGETPLTGRCLGADADGALLLQTAAGQQRIHSGDVSLR